MLTGSMCIARKVRATMSTLQAVALIPAFVAGSMLSLRRRKATVVDVLCFGDIGFGFSGKPSAQRKTKM
jgi:hypothetical protein